MKTLRFAQMAAAALVSGFVAKVDVKADPAGNEPRSKTLRQSEEERYVVVTGSHIPQRVKVKSIGTDSAYNVRIFTQEELRSTGRPTVQEALALDPSIQISGSR